MRLECRAQLDDPGLRVFDDRELAILRDAFAAEDAAGGGLVACGRLAALLAACGLEVAPETVEDLLRSLDASEDSLINYAEFVDLAAILADF